MPDLICIADLCADCGDHADLYEWNHACDPDPERWLCLPCHEAVQVAAGHVEDSELAGTMEEDPWPEGRAS